MSVFERFLKTVVLLKYRLTAAEMIINETNQRTLFAWFSKIPHINVRFCQNSNTVQKVVILAYFLPARRYASAGYRDRNVSVRLSVRHAPVLCQNEES